MVVGHEEERTAAKSPIVAPLLWHGDVPPRDEIEGLPPLLWEARAPWQAEERIGQIGPFAFTVITATRDELFGPRFGEVAERGVSRPDLQGIRPDNYPSWGYLRAWIGATQFRGWLEETPRLMRLISRSP